VPNHLTRDFDMKRADEEHCKAQFDAFVKQFFTPSQVTWEEVAQQDEPPDYYLFLDTTKFAVEVTTSVERLSVGTQSPLPTRVIVEFLRRFVKEVERVARAKSYLQGCYLVSFSRPIDDFAAIRDELQTNLLEYIRRTHSLEQAPCRIVFEKAVSQQRPQQCSIQKVHSNADQIVMGGPTRAKWEGDIAQDVYDLLSESLDSKVGKLQDIAGPKILLLRDEYLFADREMYEQCVSSLRSIGHFHTVFVVQGSDGGFLLYSRNHDLLRLSPHVGCK